jgi:hypothetical protein
MSVSRAKRPVTVTEADDVESISTVRPPFDPLEYARQSESKIQIGETDPPSARPTAPAPAGIPQYQAGVTSGTMASLGSVGLDTVPVLAVAKDDLAWFELPQPAAKLVAEVDGKVNIGTIAARARVAPDAAMHAFHELARQGIVTLRR